MNIAKIKKGIRVIAATVVAHPRLLVAKRNLAARKEGAEGEVTGPVAGHEGAWWVHHTHGIAAYWFHELDLSPNQDKPYEEEGKPYPDEP